MHHSVCAPVCAQLQQEEWFIIMIINIYQFHLLPCISCWAWMSVKEDVWSVSFGSVCFLGLNTEFDFINCSFSISMKYIFFHICCLKLDQLHLWIHFKRWKKKEKKLMAHWSHFKQLPSCRCVCGSSSHVCTDRPATAAMAPSSLRQNNLLLDFQLTHVTKLRRGGGGLSTWPAQMCKPLHFSMATTMMGENIYHYRLNLLSEDYYSASRINMLTWWLKP